MKKIALGLLAVLLSFSVAGAQVGQTGSIRGTVVDADQAPLPGATVTVSGPALMGVQSAVTSDNGAFRFPPILPPGSYTVTVELSGFNKVVRTDVVVRVGGIVDLNFQLSQAQIAEEVSVTAASPVVDVVSSRISQNATVEIIKTLPFANRDVWTFASTTAAGVRGSRGAIHGEGNNAFSFSIDGIQANASDQNWPEASMDMETVEEVEFVTGGMGAESYGARSGYMNVVTRSGGNEFHGSAQFYYTGEKMQEVLTKDEALTALGIAKPTFPIYSWDGSATLGGPVIADKIWFFSSFKYFSEKQQVAFIPVTIDGVAYGPYDRVETRPYLFGKVTFQLARNLKFFTMFSYVDDKIPHYYTSWNTTAAGSLNNRPIQTTSSNALTWVIDPNSFLDLRFGLWLQDWTGRFTEESDPAGPAYSDSYSGYRWGNRGQEEYTWKSVYNANVKFIRFQDDFLGGDHEFNAGVEYVRTRGDWGYWRQNPLTWYYYNGNRYYYRGLYGLDGPHPLYGDGSLNFSSVSTERGHSQQVGVGNRIGAFIQDQFTISQRLTLSLGLRFDTIHTSVPEQTKGAAGGSLAAAIGEYYFTPAFGFNPYLELQYPGWDNAYPYSVLAPNVGATYDLFGNGKTALKVHYGHYYDPLATGAWSGMHPSSPYTFTFRWWDENNNGQPDAPPIDRYDPGLSNPGNMLSTVFMERIDPELKNSYTRELVGSLEHELLPHLKVGVSYIHRDRKDFVGNRMFDRVNGVYWDTLELAPDLWVPFTTTVPAYGEFPASEVTVYYQKSTAPASFTKVTNIPDQKFRYDGLELTFEKRMTNGWSLGGNFNYSYQWDNGGFSNPNSRVFAEGRRGVPWWSKLYGTFQIPYGFVASFIYLHTEGGYWGRTVSVSAPTDWIQANGVYATSYNINIEDPAGRRSQSNDNLDVRLEKEFPVFGLGRLGLFVDVFNLLGNVYPSIVVNPAGTWKPVAAGSTQGTYTPGQMRVTGMSGVRSYKLSARFSF